MTTTTLPLYDDDLKALIRATTGDEPCHAMPHLWISDEGTPAWQSLHDQSTAKALCAECPIRNLCADYALTHPDEEGVWGGLTTDERAQLRDAAA